LSRCCELANYTDDIKAADAEDANGGEWPHVYHMAREAGARLNRIRRGLRLVLDAIESGNLSASELEKAGI
jgi:hypothetical protein